MAIKIRRGSVADFDATKMMFGELALTLEGNMYFCYEEGKCVEVQTKEELTQILKNYATVEELESLEEEISNTYATKIELDNYETTSHASSTYETKTNASSTYLKKTDASSTYVTKAEAQTLGKVQDVKVNGSSVLDASGNANITIDTTPSVKTVNHKSPDESGNVNVEGGGGVVSGTRAEINAMIQSGAIQDGDNYIVTDEDGIYQPSDLNEIRTAINKLTTDLSGLIKTFDFSVRTSGGGNVALANFIDLNEWTPIAVSARLANGTPINAVLYQYSSSLPNIIGGIHCTLETDMSNNYVNADIKVRVTCLHFPQSTT